MKATCTLVFVSAAAWHAGLLVSHASPAWPDSNQPPGVARFDGEPTQEERSRAFTAALNYLATLGDEEARAIIQKAQENNGNISIDQAQAQAIIDRAAKAMQNGGKLDAPAADGKKDGEKKEDDKKDGKKEDDKPLFPPDEERVKKAIAALAKDGDDEAKEIIEDFKKTRKLDISDAKRWELVSRAVEKKLIKGEDNDPKITPKEEDKPKDEPAAEKGAADPKKDAMRKRAEEAVKALAKKGDRDAKAVIERGRRNHGDMQLTEEEMKKFIDSALDKDLIEPEKANPGGEPQRMPPQQVKQLIKALAERGDRDAKAIMRKAKKNEDDEIKYTDEEEAKIIEKAKKAGLIN